MRSLLLILLLGFPLVGQDVLFGHDKVRDFHFTFKQTSWLTLLRNTASTGVDIKADLKVDGRVYTDVGIRVKGSSSNRMPGNKKPLNLTMDAFVAGQNLFGSTTLNLNNGALDPTMTREVTAFWIYRNYMPAPRTVYIRLHLNAKFWGVYILVEQPTKAMMREWFRDEDGTRYKADRPSGASVGSSPLTWLGTTVSSYQKVYVLKNPSHPNAWRDLITLCAKLNNTPDPQFKAEIVKWLDVDRALWYCACNNLVINSDDYMGAGHNYYIYFDPADGRLNMIPFDQNEAYGVHGPSSNTHAYSITTGSTSSQRPLVRRLLAVPEWRETYYAHYRVLLRNWSDWTGQIEPLTKKLQDQIRADIGKDPNYFYTSKEFDPAYKGRFWSVFHWVPGLKDLVIARRGFLLNHSHLTKSEPQFGPVQFASGPVAPGQPVAVTVKVTGNPAIKAVVLRSSVVGAFGDNPMFDDGQHGDGKANDGILGGSFTAGRAGETMRFYIRAENTAGTLAFEPENAEHGHYTVGVAFPRATGPIVVNEVLADNDSGDRDEQGEYEDWVELHNRSGQVQDVSGTWLTDDPTMPRKWQIPAKTTIPAHGFLRVWCDNEPGEGLLHATFKLAKDGESVALFDTDTRSNQLLDGLTFGRQKGDRSFGRMPDGGDHSHYLWTPSGGTPNLPSPSARRYDGRRTGSASDFKLTGAGNPRVGQAFRVELTGGRSSGLAIFAVSLASYSVDLGPLGHLGLNIGGVTPVFIPLNTAGGATVTIQVPPALAGVKAYAQAFDQDLSNALAVLFSF